MSETICCGKCGGEFPLTAVKVSIIKKSWCTVCPVCGFVYSMSTMPNYCDVKVKTVLPEPKPGDKKVEDKFL